MQLYYKRMTRGNQSPRRTYPTGSYPPAPPSPRLGATIHSERVLSLRRNLACCKTIVKRKWRGCNRVWFCIQHWDWQARHCCMRVRPMLDKHIRAEKAEAMDDSHIRFETSPLPKSGEMSFNKRNSRGSRSKLWWFSEREGQVHCCFIYLFSK